MIEDRCLLRERRELHSVFENYKKKVGWGGRMKKTVFSLCCFFCKFLI
jgi:hypothetical protein